MSRGPFFHSHVAQSWAGSVRRFAFLIWLPNASARSRMSGAGRRNRVILSTHLFPAAASSVTFCDLFGVRHHSNMARGQHRSYSIELLRHSLFLFSSDHVVIASHDAPRRFGTKLFRFTRHRSSAATNMSRETIRIVLALNGCRRRPRACDDSLLSATVPEVLRLRT